MGKLKGIPFFLHRIIRQGIFNWPNIPSLKEKEKFLALTGKLGLEFFHPSSGVHKTFLPSESWMRIHRNVPVKKVVIHAVHSFSLFRTDSGKSVKFFTGRNIYKGNRVEVWMNIFFHRCKKVWLQINLGVL